MNKLFTKAAKILVGLSLAAGVGVAVRSQKASRVDATTGSVTISTYATAHSWGSSSSSGQKSITIDSYITATCNNGTNSGKYYNDGWRIYQSETGKVTISADGATLNSVTFTFTVGNTGKLSYNNSALTSGTAKSVSGTSAQFVVGNTGSATNGQVRITEISVDYTINSSSFTPDHDGDENDPYSVADAIGAIDASTGVTGKYVSGKVSSIVEAYSSQYHNISFNISSDGSTSGDQLEAFRCKNTGNTNFTSADDVRVGASVVVYGNLTKYDTTYELGSGCYLTSYDAVSSIAVSDVSGKSWKAGQTVAATDLQVVVTYTDSDTDTITDGSGVTITSGNPLVQGSNTLNVSYSSSSGTGTGSVSITAAAAPVLSSIVLSGTYPTTFEEGDAFSHEGMIVTANYEGGSSEVVTSSATWSGYDMAETGNQTVTVSYTIGGVTKTATYTITVNEHIAAVYGLYSGALTEGDYIITHNSSVALKNELASNTNYIGYVDVSEDVSENKITDPASSIVWHIASSGDYWTIYNSAATVYASSTGAKNKGQVLSSPVAADDTDKTLWSVTSSESSTSYDFVNKQNTASSVNATLRYNAGYGFATYATGTGQVLSLYKLGFTVKTLSSITIDTEPTKTSYTEGETLDLTGLVVLADWSDGTHTQLSSGDYTVSPSLSTQLSTSNNEVTISYTYSGVEKTDSFTISVASVPLSEKDKILDKDTLLLNGSSYNDNNGDHKIDGVNFTTTAVMLQSETMQFQKSNGVIVNSGVMFDGTSGAIKTVTLFMNSGNEDNVIVSESSDKSSYSTVSSASTYSKTGVNVYNFSSNMPYFKVAASTSSVAKIDRIVVELVDGASTSLTKARNAAQAILTNLNGLCGTGGSGVVTQSQWNTLTSAVNTALDNDSTAKSILKSATRLEIHDLTQSNLKIENAMYHYDACIEKFGFTADSNITSVSAKVTPLANIISENTNTVAIIIIISMVSVTAIGGYFFIKKRKAQ